MKVGGGGNTTNLQTSTPYYDVSQIALLPLQILNRRKPTKPTHMYPICKPVTPTFGLVNMFNARSKVA
jgi:hypothetical protein